MKILLLPAVLGAALVASAQTVPPAPTLTVTEKTALIVVQQKSQELQTLYSEIAADIRTAHPGYMLDPANPLAGKLVKIPEPEKATKPALPEKK